MPSLRPHLLKSGVFEESGGFLRMRSENAQIVGGFANHTLQYDTKFTDGNGNTTIAAGFRPDVPRPQPDFSNYGIFWIDAQGASFLPGLSIQVTALSDGRVVLVAGKNASPSVFRGRLVDLGSATTLVLAAVFNDQTNVAQPVFSVNGGITVQGWGNPDGTPFTVPFFTQSPEAVFQVFAQLRLPAAQGISSFSATEGGVPGGRLESILLDTGEIGEAYVLDGVGILQ